MYVQISNFTCVTVYSLYVNFSFLVFQPVLWISENALKLRLLYLEMLSLSFSVRSSPRYNCRACELQRVRVTEQAGTLNTGAKRLR